MDLIFSVCSYSLHLLKYNSPGAIGALPIAAMVANKLLDDGILTRPNSGIRRTINDKKTHMGYR